MAVVCNFHNFFTSHEIEKGVREYLDPRIGLWNVLATMQTTLYPFKTLTNSTLAKFDELATMMVPIISTHAQSISEVLISSLGFDFFVYVQFLYLIFRIKVLGKSTLRVSHFWLKKKWCITSIIIHTKLKSWWHLLVILNTSKKL